MSAPPAYSLLRLFFCPVDHVSQMSHTCERTTDLLLFDFGNQASQMAPLLSSTALIEHRSITAIKVTLGVAVAATYSHRISLTAVKPYCLSSRARGLLVRCTVATGCHMCKALAEQIEAALLTSGKPQLLNPTQQQPSQQKQKRKQLVTPEAIQVQSSAKCPRNQLLTPNVSNSL